MTDVTLPTSAILILLLIGPAMFSIVFIWNNKKRLKDVWNLRFRRARTVRADMHTQAGRVDTRYVVPGERGLFRYRNGDYHFPSEGFEIDTKYGIPKCDFVEVQIQNEPGELVMSKHKLKVKKEQDDGTVTEEEVELPQLMVSHARLRPKLLKLARRDDEGNVVITDEPPVTSIEVADALDSKIVHDITNASLAELQMTRIFIVLIIVLVLVIIGDFAIYSKLNSIDALLQAATGHATVAAKGG